MPHMPNLSETELAERTGATPERIDRLTDLGITSREGDGTYRLANIHRVRLAEAIERSGVDLDAVGKACATGEMSFAFLDLLFPEPQGFSPKTYREASADHGLDVRLIQLAHEAIGLPRPSPDDPVRQEDLQLFGMAQFGLGLGLQDAEIARILRVYGENVYRISQAESPFFHTYVELPLMQAGASESQILEMGSQMSPMLRGMVRDLILWAYQRHQEHAIIEHVIDHLENALDALGLAPPRPARPPAMVFLDLVGYTRLTEERGDETAAEMVASLGGIVQSQSVRFGGRPVKWLGDGVMFHFPGPRDAVECSLELVEETPTAGLPPAHVGVNVGPVILRDGDYFGRTVNIAARIAARAGPGEVLVSEDVVGAVGGGDIRFEEIGPVELKGVVRPVILHRAARAGAASG